MAERGTHTWDIVVHYYKCPDCGHIIENRDKFQKIAGQLKKEIVCSRCGHHWVEIEKPKPFTFFNTWET